MDHAPEVVPFLVAEGDPAPGPVVVVTEPGGVVATLGVVTGVVLGVVGVVPVVLVVDRVPVVVRQLVSADQ